MGKCVFIYKGLEYFSEQEVLKALQQEISNLGFVEKTNSFTIVGDNFDVAYQQMVIQKEAELLYGTSEFLSFSKNNDGSINVSIDGLALEEITSGEKLIFNPKTNKWDTINVEKLIAEEKKGKKVDYPTWEQVKTVYYTEKVLNKIKDSFTNSKKTETDKQLLNKLVAFLTKLGYSFKI